MMYKSIVNYIVRQYFSDVSLASTKTQLEKGIPLNAIEENPRLFLILQCTETSSATLLSPSRLTTISEREEERAVSPSVKPRPRNYTEMLCNPQAMLHNRRLLGLPLPGQNLWQACSEWIIGNATPRSCHEHWHSYQCITKRSRLVEQLAHHRLYDTKRSQFNSYNEKDSKIHIRGHRPNITSCGSEFSCLNNKIQNMA